MDDSNQGWKLPAIAPDAHHQTVRWPPDLRRAEG
jgi:hypothetical protein